MGRTIGNGESEVAKKKVAVIPNHRNDREAEDLVTGLRPREVSFALHLVSTGGNLVEAYVAAGYQGKDHRDTMRLAEELASNDIVKRVFRDRLAANADRYRNDAGRVMEELKLIAFSSPDDYETIGSEIKVRPGVDPRAIRAVRSFKTVTVENHRTGNVETKMTVELVDKGKGLELAMRAHGLLQTDLPPLEILMNRLPREDADALRMVLSASDPEGLRDGTVVDESFVDLPVADPVPAE